jgi:hypothetical protein
MNDLVEKLTSDLMNLTVKDELFGGHKYNRSIIRKDDKQFIETTVRENLTNLGMRLSELEAKVTVYETVMANSNFKSVVEPVFEKTRGRRWVG